MCIEEGYLSPGEIIPANMAFQRSVLRMKQFTSKQIRRCYRLFGIRVFWKESKIKALGYALLYSDLGKYLLKLFSRWKKYARALLKGF
jgi:hypothetical protein